MITLYTFGPAFGLPDPSPFVTKAQILLKMAGLAYQTNTKGFGKAPKGKLPYIDDDGVVIADTVFIRDHIERRYGFDFDAGLGETDKGYAWAIEKMLENQLYWVNVAIRFMNEDNFRRGPAELLKAAPAPLRPLIKIFLQRTIRRTLHGQGLGRHSWDERAELGRRDLQAVARVLGDKPFLFGEQPCGADATAGAFVIGARAPVFDSPMRRYVEETPNLNAYTDRMLQRYYPNFRA